MASAGDENGAGDPVVVLHDKEQVLYSKGGFPQRLDLTGVMSDAQQTYTQDGDNMQKNDVIDIIVYFPDKSGVQVQVRDGQNIEAGELFELVMQEMHLPAEAREAFSLWLVSDLLELQLKPNHVPFKLVCYWEELLEKYTTAPEEHLQRDEPVIMFRRNIFYSRTEEQKITNHDLLRYLYWEAKRNILDGRYPIPQEHCDEQAGIQTLIEMKEQEEKGMKGDDNYGSVAYFKSRLADYLPLHFCKRHWFYKVRENPERRLADAFQSARTAHGSLTVEELYKKYLSSCRSQPYYGSAFFRGQAEHPKKGIASKVLSTKDDPVYVAVNVDGVFIIDMDDVVLLIGFHFENLSWQFVESSKANNNPNCLPCLFLQFPYDNNNPKATKLLQIFSREAVLMDNLIEACVELKRIQGSIKSPEESKVICGKGSIAEAFSRLALITFSEDGTRIDRLSTVRHPKATTSPTGVSV